MDPRSFAFVDLETSGVSPADDHITEIGIIRVDNGRLIDEWCSLVNPGVPIPPEIQSLTGISNAMVAKAPRFTDLISEISERLAGRIFVAHNARFDYNFLKAEFRRSGGRFDSDVLCTVRLSRKLFPEHDSHRLDAIVDRHGLGGEDRHRALGDARLIWRFVEKIWREQDTATVSAAIAELLKRPATPPHLAEGALEGLPETPGVYQFIGAGGQPLYIGKARNLRERVRAHFYAGSRQANDARLISEVHRLQIEETAGELSALIREAQLVKQVAPLHNIALRKREDACFLAPGDPGRTPKIVPIAAADPAHAPLLWGPFGSRASARAALAAHAREHLLCDRGIGIWKHDGPCFSRQLSRCHGLCVGAEAPDAHQQRLFAALESLKFPVWPFSGAIALREHNQAIGTTTVLRFDQWRLIPSDQSTPAQAAEAEFDADIYRLLRRVINNRPKNIDITDVEIEAVKP